MNKSVGVSFDPSTDSPDNNRSSTGAPRQKRNTRNSSSSSSAREDVFDFAPLVVESGSATAGLDDFSDDEDTTSLKTTPSNRPPRRDSFRSPDKLWTKDTLRSKHSVQKAFFETVFEKTVVIDNGSHFTRAGFAGNDFPSSVFRTIAAPVSTPASGIVDSSQVSRINSEW